MVNSMSVNLSSSSSMGGNLVNSSMANLANSSIANSNMSSSMASGFGQ